MDIIDIEKDASQEEIIFFTAKGKALHYTNFFTECLILSIVMKVDDGYSHKISKIEVNQKLENYHCKYMLGGLIKIAVKNKLYEEEMYLVLEFL